jgi:WD40 repeat protein
MKRRLISKKIRVYIFIPRWSRLGLKKKDWYKGKMRIFYLHIGKNAVYSQKKAFTRRLLKIFLLLIVLLSIFSFVVQSVGAEEDYSGYELLWSKSFEGPDFNDKLTISGDGGYIATSSVDSSYRAYLFDKKGNLQNLEYPESDVCGCSLYPVRITADGSYVVGYWRNESSTPTTCLVSLFDRQGNLLWSYDIKDRAQSIAITPDGNYIVVAGEFHNNVYLFDREGNLLWKNKDDLKTVVITPDGRYIAGAIVVSKTAEYDDVFLFDRQGKLLWSSHIGNINSIVMAPDGSHLAVAGDHEVYLFNRHGSILWSHDFGIKTLLSSISISSDGNYVAVGGWSGAFYIFDKQGELFGRYNVSSENKIIEIAVGADRSVVAITKGESSNPFDVVYFLDEQGNILWSYDVSGAITQAISPDLSSTCVLVGKCVYEVNMLDKNGNLLWSHDVEGKIESMRIISDGEDICVCTRSKTRSKVYFFDTQGNLLRSWDCWDYRTDYMTKQLRELYNRNLEIFRTKQLPELIEIASDGSYIATLTRYEDRDEYGNFHGAGCELNLFDRQGKLLWSNEVLECNYPQIVLSPDGTIAFSNSWPATGGRVPGMLYEPTSHFPFHYTRPGRMSICFFDNQGNSLQSNPFPPNYTVKSCDDGVSIFDQKGNLVWENKNTNGRVGIDPAGGNYIRLVAKLLF